MKLSPFMKQVEIEGGYKGFYRYGSTKITITVEENGIGVLVDERTGFPMSLGCVRRLFKPMANVWDGKKYMEQLEAPSPSDLDRLGFIEVKITEV